MIQCFFYGIDEFFLSNDLFNYLQKHKIKLMSYIFPRLTGLYITLVHIVFKDLLTDKNKKIYNKITDIINKKYNKSFVNINSLINYISTKYDYNRRTDKHKVYEYFRKILIGLHKRNPKYKKLLNIANYKCLVEIDKYYDDTNNLVITIPFNKR